MSWPRFRALTRPGLPGARWFFGLLVAAACAPPPGAGMLALTGGTVVDVVTGRSIANAVVLIRDGHIVVVGSGDDVAVPRGAQVTDLAGGWIIPGLIDASTDPDSARQRAALRHGVTAFRDLDGRAIAGDSLASASPGVPSPRRFQGREIGDSSWGAGSDTTAVISDSVGTAVARAVDAGASWIVTGVEATPGEIGAAVAAARLWHRPVAARLGITDALTAANLDVASIEGFTGVPQAAGDSTALVSAYRQGADAGRAAFDASWRTLDTTAVAATGRALAAQRVVLVATIDPTDTAAAPVQYLLMRSFVAAGGHLVVGTSRGRPGHRPDPELSTELQWLVAAGVAPLDALRAGTSWAAALLRADSLGQLRPGAVADLVVLAGNPLTDIVNTGRVVRVMLGGTWVDSTAAVRH